MKIGYANISQNTENQDKLISDLMDYGCSEVYYDKYKTGLTSQEELEYCLKALRKGDTLVSCKVEHLTIKVSSLIYLLEVLKQKHVSLILIKDKLIITQGAWDKELKTINTLLKFLTFSNSINTSYGIRKAKSLGKRIGRPPKLSKEGKDNVKYLFESKKIPAVDIAKRFNVSRSTIYRIVG